MNLLFDNFEILADAPGGVKKLREMILQLAVQGKLVPQNPNDEPASVLLVKIKKEKERLIKEGKIKKQKSLLPIANNEKPLALPDVWELSNLNTLGIINPRNELDDNEDASFVPMPLIFSAFGKQIQTETKKWRDIKKGYTHFAENDVVLAKITPCFENKKSAVMRGLANGIGSGTTELHVFRPVDKTILPEYVLIFLKSSDFIDTGKTKMTGSAGQKRVPKEYFSSTIFPLPPLPEQKRIVAKVDKLMALCGNLEKQQQEKENIRLSLNKASLNALNNSATKQEFNQNWNHITKNFNLLYNSPENVKELKQSILQLAVQGKLVPQNPKDEPASVLLKKIQAEKKRLIKEEKLNKQKPLEPIKENEMPFELPKWWIWCRLGDAMEQLTDYHANGSYQILKRNVQLLDKPDYAIMLRTTNFHHKSKYAYKYITEVTYEFLAKSKAYPGDVIMNKIADPGATFFVDDRGQPMSLAMNLFLLRFSQNNMVSRYAYFYLKASYEYVVSFASGTATSTITKDAVKKLRFPLPPFHEQKRIVAKVDKLMALCDNLSKSLADKDDKNEKLINAVVNQL